MELQRLADSAGSVIRATREPLTDATGTRRALRAWGADTHIHKHTHKHGTHTQGYDLRFVRYAQSSHCKRQSDSSVSYASAVLKTCC